LGILPLPNLETKFIAANTLFGLHRHSQMDLMSQGIEAKQVTLRDIRHQHFLARRYSEKKMLRKRDKKLREELAELLKSSQSFSGPEAVMVAHWDPYQADKSAAFFDPEWMFSLAPRMELVSSRSITGFDIVIGNPPYVRQKELKKMQAFEGLPSLERPLKDALKKDYFCYTGVADLYVYFYEKAFDLLAPGGVLCFISSNKYFRAGYGERLRHFLAANGNVRLLIDFGDAPVFTAIAYPSIILVRKTKETRDKLALPSIPQDAKRWPEFVPAEAQVRALNWEPGPSIEEFPEVLNQRGFTLPQREFKPDGWRLESPLKLRLLEKLRRAGQPLGEYVDGRFYYGIKTGLNEAFVIDRTTRDRLLAEHPSSKDIIKPFLRGRDVKRWRVEFAEQYLIKIESSENKQHPWSRKSETEAEKIFKKTYPAIYEYFTPLRKKLIDRYDQGKYFWELRTCAYWQEFEQAKILYPDIYEHQSFAWDEQGFYAANTCYFIPTEEKWLTGLLNSGTVEWFYSQISNKIRGGYLRAFSDYMQQIPIPHPPKPVEKRIEASVTKIQATKKKDLNAFVGELEAEIDGLVAHLYGLTADEYRLILDDLALPDPVRVGALNAYREGEA
ncbi:MAG: Eco57I restriction-modification methylase domain-containing protein, partial [Candidatus Binatia bacterium]